MPRYVFVYNEREKSFPERYRVVRPGEDAEALRDAENLTGTVLDAAAIDFLEELMERCLSNAPTRAELVDAADWKFVELRYRAGSDEGVEGTPTTPPGTKAPS